MGNHGAVGWFPVTSRGISKHLEKNKIKWVESEFLARVALQIANETFAMVPLLLIYISYIY